MAKNKSNGTMATDMKMPEPKPNARIELGKKMEFPKLTMGDNIKVTLHGRVNDFSDSEYSRCFGIEITDIETDKGMVGDLKNMKKKRTMMKAEEEGEGE